MYFVRAISRRVKGISQPTSIVQAVASGILLLIAQDPIGIGPLAFVALVPMWIAVARASRFASAAALGGLCGAVYFGPYLGWLLRFGWMPWLALVIACSLSFAVSAGVARACWTLPVWPLFAAGSWVGMELARGRWPWGGFAWGTVGTSQGTVPGVRWMAGVIGTYGLSALLAFASAVIAHRLVSGRTSWASLAVVGALVAGLAVLDVIAFTDEGNGRAVAIATIQAAVPRPVVHDQKDRVLESLERVTLTLAESPPDLVVWPESAVGLGLKASALNRASDVARELKAPMLVGHEELRESGTRFANLMVQFDESGRRVASYAKRHPIPFGEYVPVPSLRRYISSLASVPVDAVRGVEETVFDIGGTAIATPICFESAFPEEFRAFASAGAELLVVSTNNSSYERSAMSAQHLAHTRMRALELRQWVVQAALSGTSAVVAPDGTIAARTELFRPGVMRATVYAKTARSLYAKTGDLFSWTLVGALVLALGIRGLLRPSKRDAGADLRLRVGHRRRERPAS